MMGQLITIGASAASIITAIALLGWRFGKDTAQIKTRINQIADVAEENCKKLNNLQYDNGTIPELEQRVALMELKLDMKTGEELWGQTEDQEIPDEET